MKPETSIAKAILESLGNLEVNFIDIVGFKFEAAIASGQKIMKGEEVLGYYVIFQNTHTVLLGLNDQIRISIYSKDHTPNHRWAKEQLVILLEMNKLIEKFNGQFSIKSS